MNIGITKKHFAYTPEAYAYMKYLESFGHCVQFDFENELDPNNDINIFFMGVRPFWKKYSGRAKEIHEYQSLSTGRYPIVKDAIKRLVNIKPNKRIFLNQAVSERFAFNDGIPFIYRDMGVDENFFVQLDTRHEFDIVYCGSIEGRVGLVEAILALSHNYKIIVIGEVSPTIQFVFKRAGVYMTGPLDRKYIPQIYAKCRFGLNYTPDIYPYNIQTSTKTLEYLAIGLNVISNKYYWIEEFSKKNKIDFVWYDNNLSLDLSLRTGKYSDFLRKYSWENILERCNFIDFIENYYE